MTDDFFKVGDRVVTKQGDGCGLAAKYQNHLAEITQVMSDGRFRLSFDKIDPPTSDAQGWIVNAGTFVLADVSEHEIAELFGIGLQAPTDNSTQVELLQHIDRALRGGKLVRANLAFEFLLKSLNLTRLDLPSYVHDMQEDK